MIIGISGKIGKQRVKLAKLMAEEAKGYILVNFSCILKSVLTVLTGHIDFSEAGKAALITGTTLTASQYLQKLGDSLLKDNPNVLIVALCVNNTKLLSDKSKVCVITDVKRKREAEWIKGQGGMIIRISSDSKRELLDNRYMDHPTETEMDSYEGFDFVHHLNTDDGLLVFARAIVSLINIKMHSAAYPADVTDKILQTINKI